MSDTSDPSSNDATPSGSEPVPDASSGMQDSESAKDSVETVRGRLEKDAATGSLRTPEFYTEAFPHLGEVISQLHAEISKEAVDAARATHVNPSSDTNDTLVVDPTTTGGDSGGETPVGRIHGYELMREIARGGQGVVYMARDVRLGRLAAVKLLLSRYSDSAIARERFEREARALADLDHPNLCTIYELGFERGSPFIAMKLVDGESLSQLIKRTRSEKKKGERISVRLPERGAREGTGTSRTTGTGTWNRHLGHAERRVLEVVERCARALHDAHEARLVHRDIKPGNIMIARDGEPVILDFGLVLFEEEEGPGLTATGEPMGTPAYMSPEHITLGAHAVDRKTDVYALGVTLYECLTLRRPFKAPTAKSLYEVIVNAPTPSLRKRRPDLAEDLEVVVSTAIAKDPQRRYATAEALADDLQRVREGRPIVARPPSLAAQLMMWAERNRTVAALTLAIIVLAVAAIAWLAYSLDRITESENDLRDANQDLVEKRNELAATNEELTVSEKRAVENFERFARLSQIDAAEEILREADAVWPRDARRRASLEELRTRIDTALASLGWVPDELESLAARALPLEPADARRNLEELRRAHPELFDELETIAQRIRDLKVRRGEVARAEKALSERRPADPAETRALEDAKRRMNLKIDGLLHALAVSDRRLKELRGDPRLKRRRYFRFDSGDAVQDARDAYRLRRLLLLGDRIDELQSLRRAVGDAIAGIDSAVERQAEDAALWAEVNRELEQDARFSALAPGPRPGIRPLRRNPSTGLWEFLAEHCDRRRRRRDRRGRRDLDGGQRGEVEAGRRRGGQLRRRR